MGRQACLQMAKLAFVFLSVIGANRQYASYQRCPNFLKQFHALPSCFLAAVATWSGSNPNFLCNSFNGAEAPNVFMPTMKPVEPTYRSHPKVDACSTAPRAFTLGGSTLSRYSSV